MRDLGTRCLLATALAFQAREGGFDSPAPLQFFRCSSKAERTAVNRATEVRVLSPEPIDGRAAACLRVSKTRQRGIDTFRPCQSVSRAS